MPRYIRVAGTSFMSIESKHAYRFGYLKSEQWRNVRIEALAREKGMCQICREESLSNDAHHVWYPENIYETTERHLVILCRPCHEFVHSMLPECKTRDEDEGVAQWTRFKNAIIAWRRDHMKLFSSTEGIKLVTAHELREELHRLKTLINSRDKSGRIQISKHELGKLFANIKKLAEEGTSKIESAINLALDG